MDYYDKIAAGYPELHWEEQRRKYNLISDHLSLDTNSKLLDVGCGTGWGAEFFNCDFVGIDPSKGLLDHGLKKGLNLHHGSAENLPFSTAEFDVVISVTAVHNFNDFEAGLDEIKRVAKKDIVISVLLAAEKIQEIELAIRERFVVMDCIHDTHDLFFLCHKE